MIEKLETGPQEALRDSAAREAGDKPSFLQRFNRSLEKLRQNDDQLALVLSLLIGALVGLVTVAFILLTGRLAAHMYPAGGAGWRRVLVPVLGSLSMGYFLWRYFPFARGSGIPQTKAAIVINDGRIEFRTVLGKFFCCSASLASGIALGREGPAVHVGAGLASVIGRNLGLSPKLVKALVPAGCAAALAAAFNTPIAAVLFSLEEILGDLHATVLGSVVLSAATSWMVLHLVLGDEPLFHVSGYHLVNPVEFAVYAVLGVVGGLGSVCFVKLLLRLRVWFMSLPKKTVWFQPVVGGLPSVCSATSLPRCLGVGYNHVGKFSTAISSANGRVVCRSKDRRPRRSAMRPATRAAFSAQPLHRRDDGRGRGRRRSRLFPGFHRRSRRLRAGRHGNRFAGIVRTPFTSVIMIFEMTRDYTIIVPLMISNLIAYFISQKLQPEPIYEALAHQDGVHLPSRSIPLADREYSGAASHAAHARCVIARHANRRARRPGERQFLECLAGCRQRRFGGDDPE